MAATLLATSALLFSGTLLLLGFLVVNFQQALQLAGYREAAAVMRMPVGRGAWRKQVEAGRAQRHSQLLAQQQLTLRAPKEEAVAVSNPLSQ